MRALCGAIVLVVLLWVLALVAIARANAVPAWWPRVDGQDPGTIEEAQTLERAFASQVSKVRQGDGQGGADWRVAINPVSANAWLAARLRPWVESERAGWPDEVEQVRVAFLGDRVALGARVRGASGPVIVWATLTPEVRQDGSVWVHAHDARVGTLPVPGGLAVSRLQREVDGRLGEKAGAVPLSRVLAGEAPLSVEPVVHLPDGRDVRILELRARNGRMELSLRTEAAR